ncbi:MAG: hypothetical protein J7507_10945, partial [Pseudoxanthomonas sp.]|nr:hypothetical protein [Pseudoxanthomonas sp.]
MTLLRRLCICLLALALLPGATLQARILATPIAPAGPAQPQHDEAAADCHAALPVQEADSGNADPRQGAGPADDCCGDGASSAGCSQHCACLQRTSAGAVRRTRATG